MTGLICSAVVGAVFLATGTFKTLDSSAFLKQVLRYRLLPRRMAPSAALLFIGLECGFGVALITGLSHWLLPAAMLVLASLAGLTFWGAKSGRVEDCGCYGGLVLLSPAQSIALDGLYFALAAAAWVMHPAFAVVPRPWGAVGAAGAFAAGIGGALASRTRPLIDLSLLRAGHKWGPKWLRGHGRDLTRGAHFLVFLSRECPYCKRWVPLLNVIEVEQDLPKVTGIMSLQGEQLGGFLSEHLIRFPIAHMAQSRISLMVDAYPTAVLIEDGVIREKSVGRMPEKYTQRVRQFIQTVAPPQKSGAFGG